MSKNKHFEDTGSIYMPVISGTVSGDPVCTGLVVGVAETDRDTAGSATVELAGVFDLTVTGAIATFGLPIWINPATKALTVATGTGLVVFGAAGATKSSGAGVIPVIVGYPSNGLAAVGA